MPNNFNIKIKAIDTLIQNGQDFFARRELRNLVQEKIPRDRVLPIVSLARRLYATDISLRLLNPIVRGTGKNIISATPEEKAEYAAALTFIGASEEAFVILNGINAKDYPQVWLYEAFSLFSQWNYDKAIPLLRSYVESNKISAYQNLVGKVNLAAALVYEQSTEEAASVLSEIKIATQNGKYPLLYANHLGLAAQNAIFRNDYSEAKKHLNEASSLLTDHKGLSAFIIQKWNAIADLMQSNGGKSELKAIQSIREKSLNIHHETSRDCDRYEALINKDQSLITHLYFGTPFPSFRKRLLKNIDIVKLPDSYSWNFNASSSSPTLNVWEGLLSDKSGELKKGQLLHRLMIALSSDFYQPARLATLHHKLYPNEYFNPVSSPHRLHEAIRKIKIWFKKNRFPLSVEEKSGFYRLIAEGPCTLSIKNPEETQVNLSKEEMALHELNKAWANREFSASIVSKKLHLPLRSTQRLLAKMKAEGIIGSMGTGSQLKYYLINKNEAVSTKLAA